MTIDQLVIFDGNMPDEITIEDKSLMEQVKLIAQLEDEEKHYLYNFIQPLDAAGEGSYRYKSD